MSISWIQPTVVHTYSYSVDSHCLEISWSLWWYLEKNDLPTLNKSELFRFTGVGHIGKGEQMYHFRNNRLCLHEHTHTLFLLNMCRRLWELNLGYLIKLQWVSRGETIIPWPPSPCEWLNPEHGHSQWILPYTFIQIGKNWYDFEGWCFLYCYDLGLRSL